MQSTRKRSGGQKRKTVLKKSDLEEKLRGKFIVLDGPDGYFDFK